MSGKQTGKAQMSTDRKAQSSLEITIALIAVFIFLLGATKIFVWLNERMVLRQEAYEDTRIAAAKDNPGVQVDESSFAALDIFGSTD